MSKNGLLAFITFMFMVCLNVLGVIAYSLQESLVMWSILPLAVIFWIFFWLTVDGVR